ncbi:hypothetical protein L557_2390, partial [Bordetella pertussis STO1-CNMC-0004]
HRARCTHLQTQPGRIQPIDSSQLANPSHPSIYKLTCPQ